MHVCLLITAAEEIMSGFDIPYIVTTSTTDGTCHASQEALVSSDFLISPCSLWCSDASDSNAWIMVNFTEMFYMTGVTFIQHSNFSTIHEYTLEYASADAIWTEYSGVLIHEVLYLCTYLHSTRKHAWMPTIVCLNT